MGIKGTFLLNCRLKKAIGGEVAGGAAGYGQYGAEQGYADPYGAAAQQQPQASYGDQGGGASGGRGAGGPPKPKEARDGDWACPGCGNVNFSFRCGIFYLCHSIYSFSQECSS